MTVVVGTAGHIDHGKTTLLRALTGIDADRLPEERRRGMTIDVGYAHLAFDDGTELDFVDVPGHDRLVGNMLVGAGEIDAAMLVVAADDGVRAQTREHMALLDALRVTPGIAVVTKADVVDPPRLAEVVDDVAHLLTGTSLAGSPVISVSAVSGDGLAEVRAALETLRDQVLSGDRPDAPRHPEAVPPRLAVDRVFTVKGRGLVVTGTLRGGSLTRGASLRVVPGDGHARVRGIQVHGHDTETAPLGRTALNLAGTDPALLHRGVVFTADAAVVATSRILVRLRRPLPDRTRARLHLGTVSVDASVGRSGRDAIDLPDGTVAGILRLADAIAVAPGDRFVLRGSGGPEPIVGGVVLDAAPPRGVSRRRQTTERFGALAGAVDAADRPAHATARLDLHGLLAEDGRVILAADVTATAEAAAIESVETETTLTTARSVVARQIRRAATGTRDDAAAAAGQVIDDIVRSRRLIRDGDLLRRPGTAAAPPDAAMTDAMDRLERALAVLAPPSLRAAARDTGCPPTGIQALERSGRIILLEPDLAYAMTTYRDLAATALALAVRSPLTPAAYRDATGTSRKYVMAILEDLDRRGILRRTPDGHVPGPRAPARTEAT
jgi:selenocysteine-specific elongation factor